MNVTGATRNESGDVMATSIPTYQSVFKTFEPQREVELRAKAIVRDSEPQPEP
jgi:hypothetical protein